MSELKPCPFCGGKAEIEYPQMTEIAGHEYQEPEIFCECGIAFAFKWDNQSSDKCSCCNNLAQEITELWNARTEQLTEEDIKQICQDVGDETWEPSSLPAIDKIEKALLSKLRQ